MVNYSPQLVSVLETILPTHYELFCDSNTAKPCITWTEYNNYDEIGNDQTKYSYIEYMIKVWATDIKTATETAVDIDRVLKPLGFERMSSNELKLDNQICKLLTYRIHSIEY